jgi:hypothetical protein
MAMKKVTKKALTRIARKGNFDANRMGSELACNICGVYDFESKHEDNCPVEALLKLIENSDFE